MFVKKGQILEGIVYKTPEIIVQKIQEGRVRNKCYIIGNGHSLSVDGENRVVLHDPGMSMFKPKINKDYTVYAWYFPFECQGLEAASRDLAKFVKSDCYQKFTKIAVIGHSKCGFCAAMVKEQCSYVKAVTVSTPWKGTFMADAVLIRERTDNTLVLKIHDGIFSNHNVDKDITPKSKLVKREFYVDVMIASKLEFFSDCCNPIDAFLFFWDNILDVNGDGIVPFGSQLNCECEKIRVLSSSHASSLKKGLKLLEEDELV